MNFALCHICSRPDVPLDDGGRMTEHYEPDSIMAAVGPPCHGSGQTPQAVEKECRHDGLCDLIDLNGFKYGEVGPTFIREEVDFRALVRCQSCRAVFRLECGWLVEEEAFQDSGGNIMTPREGKPHSADGPNPLTPPSFQQNQQPESEVKSCDSQKTLQAQCHPKAETTTKESSPSADPVPSSIGTTLWQPIATAPKDRTWILLTGGVVCEQWYGTETKPAAVVGTWEEDEWYFADWDGALRSAYEKPSHWMPLPTPPNAPPTPSTLSSDLRALLSRHSPLSPDDRAAINEFYLSQRETEGVRDKEIADAFEKFDLIYEYTISGGNGNWHKVHRVSRYGLLSAQLQGLPWHDTFRSAVIAAITAEEKGKTE